MSGRFFFVRGSSVVFSVSPLVVHCSKSQESNEPYRGQSEDRNEMLLLRVMVFVWEKIVPNPEPFG